MNRGRREQGGLSQGDAVVLGRFRRLAAILIAIAVVVFAREARAGDAAYCKRVRARADSEAALLLAPTVRAEALKLPRVGATFGRFDPTAAGSNYQVRVAGTVSAVNVYKGTRAGFVADADCAAHEATMSAQELLTQAADYGRLPALRAEVSFLDRQRPLWEQIAASMGARFAEQNVTLLSLEDVRIRVTNLERQRAQLGSEVARLETLVPTDPRPNLAKILAKVDTTQKTFEREASHVRSLDPWDATFTVGYVPPVFDSNHSDYFGIVTVSYSLGALSRNAAEQRYLLARAEETREARYETQAQLRLFRNHMQSARRNGEEELAILERRLRTLESTREQLQGSEATIAAYALAMLELELISVRADHVFLTEYVRALLGLEEG